jgi:hypothetical protein
MNLYAWPVIGSAGLRVSPNRVQEMEPETWPKRANIHAILADR